MTGWQPTQVVRPLRFVPSSTQPLVVETDAGTAVVKAMGNPEGPHALVRELVGTRLASLFGLPTFDLSVFQVDEPALLEIGGLSYVPAAGPAIATRYEQGDTWKGQPSTLRAVQNAEAFCHLIAFDTWIRNRDRFHPGSPGQGPRVNRGNVFLSREDAMPGQVILKAIDHTHCFASGDLSAALSTISNTKDETVFGCFPQFRRLLDRATMADAWQRLPAGDGAAQAIEDILRQVPPEWELSSRAAAALRDLLLNRAIHLRENPPDLFAPTEHLYPASLFDDDNDQDAPSAEPSENPVISSLQKPPS